MTKKKETEKKPFVARHLEGFGTFVREQGIVGLAVGLVLGTAASTLVNSLINNIIMPPLGFLLGSSEGLKGLYWELGETATGEMARLQYGAFVSDFINFLVIAWVVYIVVKWLRVEIRKK